MDGLRAPILRFRALVREVGTAQPRLLLAAAGVGVVAGLGVAALEHLVADGLFDLVLDQPIAVAAVMPLVGLVVCRLCLRWFVPGGDGATTDAYVRAYHAPERRLRLRDLWGRLGASAATLGSGAALGFEGPSILLGATAGATVQRRLGRRTGAVDARVLMVAGAAAGVAAIFKAPLTGVVFALEVPYRQDLARRALLPALVAAGSSYLVFAALAGTEPILLSRGAAAFDVADLGGAVLLGLACGVLAHIGARAIAVAKGLPGPSWALVLGAGAGLAALALASEALFDQPLSLGSGYRAIDWASSGDHSLGLLVGLFAVRASATWLAIAGGGVGGLFVPLVVQGAVTGAIVQSVVDVSNPTLFPTIGIAAFLGAGYRTPLAGVAFVAEATGQPGFVVPAFLAAVVAQMAMGTRSFSAYQRIERQGHLEQRLALRVEDVLAPTPDTIAPGATVAEFVERTMAEGGHRSLPVVDQERYLGTMRLAEAGSVPRSDWDQIRVEDVMRVDVAVEPTTPVVEAAAAMHRAGLEQIAVVRDGVLVGVLSTRDLTRLEQLLDLLPGGKDLPPP